MIYLLLVLSCTTEISAKQIDKCLDICRLNEGLSKVVTVAGHDIPIRCHCGNEVRFIPPRD